LLKQFQADAARNGLAPASLTVTPLPFDAMVPALEAGIVDAALLKGAHALLAQKQGHKILYQNWDVKGGDECCPASIAQVEFLLLAPTAAGGTRRELVEILAAAAPPARAREITAAKTAYPPELLAELPVAEFKPLTPSELGHLLENAGDGAGDTHETRAGRETHRHP
jgi:ABC-type nitrate/sulfonate/bicarbonate transport system substrate-binding protein